MTKAKRPVRVNPRRPLLVTAARLITARLDEMMAHELYLADPARVYELHEMRIAAKRLRYTMEIFQEAYAAYSDISAGYGQTLKAVKLLQEHLGQIHDADVLVPQLHEHLAHLLQPGYGTVKVRIGHDRSEIKMPVAGVHHVDLLACEGLLALSRQIQTERDAHYERLLQTWNKAREEELFEKFRVLLKSATHPAPPALTPIAAILSGVAANGLRDSADLPRPKTEAAGTQVESAVAHLEQGLESSGEHPIEEDASTPAPDAAPANVSAAEETAGLETREAQPVTGSTPPHPARNNSDEAAPGEISQVPRAPGEPGHVAAARRRQARRREPVRSPVSTADTDAGQAAVHAPPARGQRKKKDTAS